MIVLRRGLLELWAMALIAAVVGFLGPFGTYLEADFLTRVWNWSMHLLGAYVIVRPSIIVWDLIARSTGLPRRATILWGVALTSVPLALVWRWGANALFDKLNGYAEILPLAFLSALAVLAAVTWARRADEHFLGAEPPDAPPDAPPAAESLAGLVAELPRSAVAADQIAEPAQRLRARLSPGFAGPIIALQSEDHYVRVHGAAASELLLMRLRDAIAELDDAPGEQTHRSWWVAQDAVKALTFDGRAHSVVLTNGLVAPVARGSVARLRQTGFLPAPETSDAEE